MLIMGIDPGIGITGYGFVEKTDEKYSLIASGSIQTDKNAAHPLRLLELKNDLDKVIKKYNPDCAAVEKLFFFKNQKTIIHVAQARGVIMLVLAQNNIPIYEYTPLEAKQAITGHGRADKVMVKTMVKNFIEIGEKIKLDDTIDSIALALCHGQNMMFKKEAQ